VIADMVGERTIVNIQLNAFDSRKCNWMLAGFEPAIWDQRYASALLVY
jgi:hypothetical protein